MTTEFGRRKPAAKTQASAKTPVATTVGEKQGGAAELIFSSMFGPLGGVILGCIVVCIIASFYISNMRGMGRSLDESWSKKTIGPVEDSWSRKSIGPFESDAPDLAEPSRRPCDVRSLNPEFRKLQRELGC